MFPNPIMMEMFQNMMSDPSIMQHTMGAMSGNASDLQALFASPSMQRMMRNMAEHPELLFLLMQSNPRTANDPKIQSFFKDPHVQSLLKDPQIQSILTDPEILTEQAKVDGFGASNSATNPTKNASNTANTPNIGC